MLKIYIQRCLGLFLLLFMGSSILPAQTGALNYLEKEFVRFEALSGGKIGVGIYHIESQQELYFNENEAFPMASSFKVAIAVQLLRRVEAKQLRLDSMITLRPTDLHPGSGTLSNLFDDPGVMLSVRNLLELMLLISDNSATDICLRLAGGSEAVNNMLSVNGIEGQHLDRSTLKLIADYVGVAVTNENAMTFSEFNKLAEKLTPEQQKRAAEAFSKDRKDTSTPKAMTQLLLKIWKGNVLNPENTKLLLDIMYRCQTGETRIKGFLAPGIRVAHKTGTIGGTTNDVGIIELPDKAGNVIVSVFVKDSTKEIPEREKAIAHVARAVYDYFLYKH